MNEVIIILATVIPSVGAIIGGALWYEFRNRKLVNQKISDQTVIEIAKDNNGKINVALLCERAGISAWEAKVKLKYLKDNKVLAIDWGNLLSGGENYILPGSSDVMNKFGKMLSNNPWAKRLGISDILINQTKNITNISDTSSFTQSKDAQIIALALEKQGVVSASLVCVKLNVSIDEAQRLLENLRQKQIFITEVGQGGALLYRLLDA